MAKRSALVILLLLYGAFIPSTASAATIDEIIALSKAGVSDTVLLALIDRDKSVFAIEADELIALKSAGVSEAVVVAMLKSGREPAPPVPVAPAALYPNFVIVGHGPDRPNTFHRSDGFAVPTVPVVPYVVVVPGVVGAGCVGVSASGPKPVAAGRPTPNLGVRLGSGVGHMTASGVGHMTASGVGHIVNDTAIPAGTDGAASASVIDCRHTLPPARPRSRR